MLLLWFVLTVHSFAAGWSDPKPYVRPILSAGVVSVDGQAFGQATGGAVGGFTMRRRGDIPILSHTRARATGTYGLNSGSLGADLRLGSFIGPDTKLIQYQFGPDVYYNGYGDPNAPDYFLAWAPGLDLVNTLLVKLSKPVRLYGEITPGWVFNPDRRTGIVSPFDELLLLGAVVIRTKPINITVGVQRRYSAAGEVDSLVLSGAI